MFEPTLDYLTEKINTLKDLHFLDNYARDYQLEQVLVSFYSTNIENCRAIAGINKKLLELKQTKNSSVKSQQEYERLESEMQKQVVQPQLKRLSSVLSQASDYNFEQSERRVSDLSKLALSKQEIPLSELDKQKEISTGIDKMLKKIKRGMKIKQLFCMN